MEEAHITPTVPTVVPVLLDAEMLRRRLKPSSNRAVFRNWLARAVARHAFPQGLRVGDRIRAWREDEVLAWLDSRERGGRFDGTRPRRESARGIEPRQAIA